MIEDRNNSFGETPPQEQKPPPSAANTGYNMTYRTPPPPSTTNTGYNTPYRTPPPPSATNTGYNAQGYSAPHTSLAPTQAPRATGYALQHRQMYPPPPQPKRRNGSVGRSVLLVVLCLIFAATAGFAGGYIANVRRPIYVINESDDGNSQAITASGSPAQDSDDSLTTPEGSLSAFDHTTPSRDVFDSSSLVNNPTKQVMTAAEVAAMVKPSVVEIKTETVNTGSWAGTYISEGAGSGVIISEDGYIITNDHVISGASSITVRLDDGREFPASLIATDRRTDIAVIRISETGLPYAVFGDSSKLVVGESALAVGNPLGELGGTVTGGMISALDREMIIDGETMTLLQTDAAVNPGNSGGGLFNMYGELIGVVNAKSSGVNIEGLGFAIPSNIAKAVANDLATHGYVRGRAETGLELLDIQSSQSARWYRVSEIGLYIISSADDQLRNGDRITAVNGYPVANLADYNAAMSGQSIGDTISITVSRGNESITAQITLTEWKP